MKYDQWQTILHAVVKLITIFADDVEYDVQPMMTICVEVESVTTNVCL